MLFRSPWVCAKSSSVRTSVTGSDRPGTHVAEDCLGVLIVNGLALCQLLIQQAQTHLTGADDRDQLFELGHLSRVGCLVPQHPYMVRQAATVNVVRPFTQEVEHLRKCKCH